MKSLYSFICIYLSVFCIACNILNSPSPPQRNNPTDPANPNYQAPLVEITAGALNNTTILTDSVTFQWRGNLSDDQMLFSYKLDNNNWSPYNQQKKIVLDLLDEGPHTFSAKAKYLNNTEQQTPTQISFTVDAVKGSALKIVPKKTTVARNGVFEVELFTEEAADFAGAKVVMQYDKNILDLDVTPEIYKDSKSVLLKNGGSIIDIVEIDKVNGLITLNLAVAGGTTTNVNGTGALAKLRFKVITSLATTTEIKILESSSLRKNDNTQVMLNAKGSSTVIIQ